jgi:hypothetical protein
VSAYHFARIAIRNCTFKRNNATFGAAILLFGNTTGWLRTVWGVVPGGGCVLSLPGTAVAVEATG